LTSGNSRLIGSPDGWGTVASVATCVLISPFRAHVVRTMMHDQAQGDQQNGNSKEQVRDDTSTTV